jgi:putative flippase GtrA
MKSKIKSHVLVLTPYFIRHLVVGFFLTFIGVLGINFMSNFLEINIYVSLTTVYFIGAILSFWLNARVVFYVKTTTRIFFKFILFFLVSLVSSLSFYQVALNLGLHHYFAQFISVISYSVVNFLINKLYVYVE